MAAKKGKTKKAVKAAKGRKAAPARARSVRKAAKARKPAAAPRIMLYGNYLSTPTAKVGLMLSLCGKRFDYTHIDLRAGEHKAPEFLAMNRYGQVPVLRHGDTTLCQANVILAYLAETFGKFGGRTPAERARIAEWLAWDLDRMASIGLARLFTRNAGEPKVIEFAKGRGELALDALETQLGKTPFLAGRRPTIADISAFCWVSIADEGGFDASNRPNLQAWMGRMKGLKGSKHQYEVLPKESRAA